MLNLFLFCLYLVLIYKTLVFLLSLILKRNDIADVSWGLSFILIVLGALFWTRNFSFHVILVSVLVFIWGSRLSIRIFLRNRRKKEDFRYALMREQAGKYFLIKSLLQVFILQGLLALLVCIPILLLFLNRSEQGFSLVVLVGTIVWTLGFVFETVGDYQLDQFLSEPTNKGKLLQSGLWFYSRHPNYFGEITLWWGIFIISLSSLTSVVGIIGPLAITFLITKVSGIPLLENKYLGNKEFENYKNRTSVLFPLPPKPR